MDWDKPAALVSRRGCIKCCDVSAVPNNEVTCCLKLCQHDVVGGHCSRWLAGLQSICDVNMATVWHRTAALALRNGEFRSFVSYNSYSKNMHISSIIFLCCITFHLSSSSAELSIAWHHTAAVPLRLIALVLHWAQEYSRPKSALYLTLHLLMISWSKICETLWNGGSHICDCQDSSFWKRRSVGWYKLAGRSGESAAFVLNVEEVVSLKIELQQVCKFIPDYAIYVTL
jgi:hypothetical protein